MSFVSKVLVYIGLLFISVVWLITSWVTGQPIPSTMTAQGVSTMPTPEQFVAVVAAILIPVLATAFKASGLADPEKSWAEFFLSLIVAYVGLVVTGKLPVLPTLGVDPLQWATIIGQFLGVIFTLAAVVYNLFKDQIKTAGVRIAGK